MASKATVQRQRSSEKVVAGGRTHRERIRESMTEAYNAEVGDAAVIVITAVTDDLEKKTDTMVECDDAHEQELRDDPQARDDRDSASEKVQDILVTQRGQLETIAGPQYVAKLGFQGKTPTNPVEVHRLATTVISNLASEPAPQSLIPGYTFDPEPYRVALEEALANLAGHTANVAKEEREAEATLTNKHAAIAAFDKSFAITANMVSTLLETAGEVELAKRVRPSTRRPGQTAEDAPPADAEAPVEGA